MRQREENAVKAQIYDDFSDYVTREMRNRDNPNLTVRDFNHMARAGLTHMELVLENVETASEELFTAVKEFKPGSYLKTKEVIKDGSQQYVAFIPYVSATSTKRRLGSGVRGESGGPPSQTRLMLYLFGLMIMIVTTALKTTSAEWYYMMGRK